MLRPARSRPRSRLSLTNQLLFHFQETSSPSKNSAVGRHRRPSAQQEHSRHPCPDRSEQARWGSAEGAHGRTPVRAVFITPHHRCPTTVTLKAAGRLAPVDRARSVRHHRRRYDHAFHYDGRPIRRWRARTARTRHLRRHVVEETRPGLRIGYIVAPARMIRSMTKYRSLLDTQGDHATEAAVTKLIEHAKFRGTCTMHRIYANQRDVLVFNLRRILRDDLRSRCLPTESRCGSVSRGPSTSRRRHPQASDVECSSYTRHTYTFNDKTKPFARTQLCLVRRNKSRQNTCRRITARALDFFPLYLQDDATTNQPGLLRQPDPRIH